MCGRATRRAASRPPGPSSGGSGVRVRSSAPFLVPPRHGDSMPTWRARQKTILKKLYRSEKNIHDMKRDAYRASAPPVAGQSATGLQSVDNLGKDCAREMNRPSGRTGQTGACQARGLASRRTVRCGWTFMKPPAVPSEDRVPVRNCTGRGPAASLAARASSVLSRVAETKTAAATAPSGAKSPWRHLQRQLTIPELLCLPRESVTGIVLQETVPSPRAKTKNNT